MQSVLENLFKNETYLHCLMLAALALIFFFLPASQFAQREHLLVMLVLPYWFLTAVQCHGKMINQLQSIIITLFAALGFALKPFFLVPWLLIEVYFFLVNSYRLRIEFFIISGVLGCYMLSIVIWQPDYLQIILPLVSKYYFIGAHESWMVMFSRPAVIYCIAVLCAYSFVYRYYQHGVLAHLLALGLTGFIAAFLIPRSAWYYHVLPALSFACLLMTLLLAEMMKSPVMLGSSILVVFALPFNIDYRIFAWAKQEKNNQKYSN